MRLLLILIMFFGFCWWSADESSVDSRPSSSEESRGLASTEGAAPVEISNKKQQASDEVGEAIEGTPQVSPESQAQQIEASEADEEDNSDPHTVSADESLDKNLNMELKSTHVKVKLKAVKREVELRKQAENLSDEQYTPSPIKTGIEGLWRSTPSHDQVNKDTESVREVTAYSPEDVVKVEYRKRLQRQNMDKAEKDAFVAEFVENARADGIAIEVNQDYKIISVRKIRPIYKDRYPTGTGAGTR